MATYSRERTRMAVDVTSHEPITDVRTGSTPTIWRGTDLAIELAFAAGADGLVDVSAYSTVTIEIRDAQSRKQLIATKSLATSDLHTALTQDAWEAGTDQHGTWTWTSDETRWDLQGEFEREFWLVISAITTDTPARKVTLGGTTLRVVEDGAGETTNSPTPGDPTYPTLTQVQNLIGQVIRPGNNPAGTTITLTSANGQWARIIGVNNDGSPQDTIVQLT